MMRLILIILLSFSFCANAQNDFDKIKLNELPIKLEGFWLYKHSLDSAGNTLDSLDIKSGINFRVSISKTRPIKKLKLRINYPKLLKFSKSSPLKHLGHFPNFKGRTAYLKLESDSIDSSGFLIKSKVIGHFKKDIKRGYEPHEVFIIRKITDKLIYVSYTYYGEKFVHIYEKTEN